ncbi:MAG TPA: VanZ family protein [Burkholderiales bacterium]|nr:VanZ family protein [Burkholderiales bacterium]
MRRACIAVGWALVAFILWASLTPSPPKIDFGIEQADKLGHAGAYAATMFWFAQLYVRGAVRLRYALGLIVLGIALEFIQGHVGRDFEVADMVADAIGVALGWLAALAIRLRIPAD